MSTSLPPVLIVSGSSERVEPVVRFLQTRGTAAHLIEDIHDPRLENFQSAPALILIADDFPEGKGFTLCRRLKGGMETQAIPIIMLLSAANAAARDKTFEAGADDYLLSPIRTEELEARLRPHMQGLSDLETLHVALEAAHDAAFLCAHGGDFVYVNEAACRSLGYSREELLGLGVADIDPGYAHHRFETDKKLVAEGTDIRMTLPSVHRRRDGSEFPVEVSVSTFRMADAGFALCMVRDITERRAAEERLHASEQAFRAMVENSPDLISRYDRDFRRIYMNPAFLRHCFQHADELLGKTPLEAPVLMNPADFMACLQRVMQEKQEIIQEVPVRDAAGELHWGHVRLVPEFDSQGDVVSILSIGRDITQIKESEHRFRTLAENFPDLLMRFDWKARHTYVNPAVTEAFGLPDQHFIGKQPSELEAYGDHSGDITAAIKRAFSSGQADVEEIRLPTAQGDQIYEMRFIPKRDSTKSLVAVLVIGRNVTQLRQTEQALRTSEREFRTLAENSPTIIVRYDLNCRRTYVNPAFVKQSGIPREKALFSDIRTRWNDEDSPDSKAAIAEYLAKIREVIASGVPGEIQMQGLRETGETALYAMYLVPEYGVDGTVIGALAIGHDITPLKQAESRLEESYKLLQELTSRRETAREEERTRMAREIHDELGQRLTAIRLRMGMLRLQKCDVPCSLDAPIATLIDMTDQTLKVVRDVSALLRPAALELGLNPGLDWLAEEFQRNTGIACSVDLMVLKPVLTETQATVLFRCAQESLTNVARHSGAREVRISLEEADDNYVLEIVDNGLGFDMASPKVARFGLAGIRERMLSVGGAATVESSPGNGTRIRVTLPIGNGANDGR